MAGLVSDMLLDLDVGTAKEIPKRNLGAVYTTRLLAEWTASLLDSMTESKNSLVVDPACGDGALLHAIGLNGFKNLVGIDCDAQAVEEARARVPFASIYRVDGLAFLGEAARDNGTLDAVIANPPWGATLLLDRHSLASIGYRAFGGQSDSWDLFVEGVIRALKPGAPAILILPDALFLPEHRVIRGILTRDSHITMIARLGEGFFSGVYRGTVVVAVRKGAPKPKARVACARLSPEARKSILSGGRSLAASVQQSIHFVDQARFTRDPEHRFDIDSRKSDHAKLAAVEERSFPWDEWFHIGRGIELSKSGRIIRCPKCLIARPLPRDSDAYCSKCHHEWKPIESDVETIVRQNDGVRRRGWHPLIVGEDVERHAAFASRLIRLGLEGIRYKSPAIFSQPKLLVRKTGLGIKATVDFSGSATNQVVFHFTVRRTAPDILLDYMAGVLCSRVMLAWHLKRQGDLEWRSHPYVTPRLIRRFPVPLPQSEDDWTQANAIASAVQARRKVSHHDSDEDLMVERLVAGMYGLADNDMQWILSVLDSAQQLEPIRTLRISDASLISPLRIVNAAK